jgi:hypothetical protein
VGVAVAVGATVGFGVAVLVTGVAVFVGDFEATGAFVALGFLFGVIVGSGDLLKIVWVSSPLISTVICSVDANSTGLSAAYFTSPTTNMVFNKVMVIRIFISFI